MDNQPEIAELDPDLATGSADDSLPESFVDAAREEIARLSEKMSNKVRIQRWAGPLGPVVGPSLIIADINKVAESLAGSGFMKPWVIGEIKKHLLNGGAFMNRGASRAEYEDAVVPNGQVLAMQVRSEYRMATEKEVLDYVDNQEFANLTGHAVSRRAQEKGYILRYHEGPAVIMAYDRLPRQAKVILDLLNDTGRESFTEASIEVILAEHADELKTRQEPIKLWGFYRRRLIDEGHVEESE
jgi:hypothetical protein